MKWWLSVMCEKIQIPKLDCSHAKYRLDSQCLEINSELSAPLLYSCAILAIWISRAKQMLMLIKLQNKCVATDVTFLIKYMQMTRIVFFVDINHRGHHIFTSSRNQIDSICNPKIHWKIEYRFDQVYLCRVRHFNMKFKYHTSHSFT